jgi:hypothetical protein
MKKHLETIIELLIDNIKYIIIILLILINLIGYFATRENTYKSYLFYPDKNNKLLIAERRKIIKAKSKKEIIKNIIDELFLGTENKKLNNIFPKKSKVLSVRFNEDTLYINLNKNTVNDLSEKIIYDSNFFNLFFLSIVNTVCFEFRDIKLVKFYFNSKEYKYLDKYGPYDNGIKPNWNIIKK